MAGGKGDRASREEQTMIRTTLAVAGLAIALINAVFSQG